MLMIPGQPGKDLCDAHLGVTRRALLRIGGTGLFGLSLPSMLRLQAAAAQESQGGGPGWGRAKSIILVYLQGGPSHLDLWDPKTDVPDNVRSAFKPIDTRVPGIQVMETLPKLATVTDKFTFIRSVVGAWGGHDAHQCTTGWRPQSLAAMGGRPSIGSVVARRTASITARKLSR